MTELLDLSPASFSETLAAKGGRAYVVGGADGSLRASAEWLEPLAAWMGEDGRDFADHEGVFLATGPETGALFGAFVHKTVRGQAAGGLRHWPYDRMESLLRDGLRLAVGMSRKNALAGLWWGGGKGIIARGTGTGRDNGFRDPQKRAAIYREYGSFVSSLRGCYVTAEDVGTAPWDLRSVHEATRFATCVPASVGGSGNPSPATAKGVVCAMEGALEHLGRGTLESKKVAMQGAGNVAAYMMEELVARGASVVASDIDEARLDGLRKRFAGKPVELRHVGPKDLGIFGEPCDVFAPNALGGILRPDTIERLQTKIVCGAANNQLLDDRRDDRALAARGITYVPDFVANRMGIVNCANEQYGIVDRDPAIERHFGRDWDNAVFVVTKRVLARAEKDATTTSDAANRLADEATMQPHPVWGHRGRAIIDGLVDGDWAHLGD